jgi:hypothetical protein
LLCLFLGGEQDFSRCDFESLESWRVVDLGLSAIADPAEEQVIFPGAGFNSLAAVVLYLHGGLLKDQAVGGNFGVDATEKFVVVIFEVVAEERESESASPLKGSMAGATVAAKFSEEWGHVLLEVRSFARSLRWGIPLRDGREGGWVLWGSEAGCGSEGHSECHGCEQKSASHGSSLRVALGAEFQD